MKWSHPHDALITHNPTLARRTGGIFSHTIHIMNHPARIIFIFFRHYFRKRYAHRHHHPHLIFALDLSLIAILLALASLVTWLFFFRITLTDLVKLNASTTPTIITSGAPVTFTVSYENQSSEKIREALLAIRLPRHFEVIRTYPKAWNARSGTLTIGILDPHSRGEAKITGIAWGDVGTSIPFYSTLAFTSEKTDLRSVTFNRTDVAIQQSVLDSTLTLPEQLVRSQSIPFTFSYRNIGLKPLPNVVFTLTKPETSISVSSDPRASDRTWSVGTLAPGAGGSIAGDISIPASTAKNAEIFTIEGTIEINHETITQSRSSTTVPIVAPPLTFTTSLQGDRGGVVIPGTSPTITISVTNVSTSAVRPLSLDLEIQNPFVDPASLPAPTIIPEISPGETKIIDIPITILHQPMPHSLDAIHTDGISLHIHPIAHGLLRTNTPLALTLAGQELVRKIETPLVAHAIARYFTSEGEQIGRGPLPPIVGDTTKYWVFWSLDSTTDPLAHAEFKTTLAPGVTFAGPSSVSIGSPLVWDAQRRVVTWTIDALPATASTGAPVTAAFEVALTPTIDDVGAPHALTDVTSFNAVDNFTQRTISATAAGLDTTLPTDRRARSRGIVVGQ